MFWQGYIKWAVLVAVVVMLIVFVLKATKRQGYLDYMPTAVEPCPSHYRCGATTRKQAKMENNLYSDLREANKYTLPETVTGDEYDVIATESEPTKCMLKRAAKAREKPMPEGQYTPYDEIEDGFSRKKMAELYMVNS